MTFIKKKKKRSTRKNNIDNVDGTENDYYDHNDHDVIDNYMNEERQLEDKPPKKGKQERYDDINRTLHLVNLSILK